MESNKKDVKIAKIMKDIDIKVDELSAYRGYNNVMRDKIINPEITPLEIDNYGINNVKVLQDTLFNVRGRDKLTKERINDLAYASMETQKQMNHKDLQQFMRPRVLRNLEYNYILSNMQEIKSAINQLAEDVVFPNSNIKSGILLKFSGNNNAISGERDSDLSLYFRPHEDISISMRSKRIYSFDIDEFTKESILNLATYGYQLVATIPYKSIVTDLLYEASKLKEHDAASESFYNYVPIENKNSFIQSFYERYDFLASNKKITSDMSLNDSIVNNVTGVGESASDVERFVTQVPYSETDVDVVVKYMKESGDLLFNENISAFKASPTESVSPVSLYANKIASKEDISGVLPAVDAGNSNNLYNNAEVLEELKKKRNKKFLIDNIKGSTLEVLDNNKVLPVFIKDELIGAYVLDRVPEENKIKLSTTITNVINSSALDDGITFNDYHREAMKEMLLKDIGGVLKRNVDKSFLRNNPNIIEDIEYLLQDYNVQDLTQTKIRFIPAEYLTLFKIGPGPLGQSLLAESRTYALMHIQLAKSEMINKVFLNKPRLKVSVTDNGNVSSGNTIGMALTAIRDNYPRLSDVGVPDMQTDSIMANYQTVILHRTPDGQEAIEATPIGLEEPRDNTDFLRYLRNQATLPIGYPSDMLDPSQNIDFAKKISHINTHTLIKVITMQNALVLSLSELCTKRLKYTTGNDSLSIEVEFSRPKEIDENTAIEALDKVQRVYESYETIINANPEYTEEVKNLVKFKLSKKLLEDYLDMNILEELKERAEVEGVNNL